jgi:transglutaminase/protease-like cytokinesis protein 3
MGYHTPRNLSPCPPSPGGGEGFTPSPLREAMDDVMEQLDALGVSRETESPEPPFDPWSPDSFQRLHEQSRKKRQNTRPMTSMGLASQVDEGYETHSGTGNSSRDATCQDVFKQEKPQPELSNYVERMESKLRTMQHHNASVMDLGSAPTPPPKGLIDRPKSSMDVRASPGKLRHKKSAYEVGRQVLERTFTTKTTSTNSSSATQSTNRSLMSGSSAGALSATSAGSLARKNMVRAQSAFGMRDIDSDRPETPFTGVTYHSSHASGDPRSKSQIGFHDDAIGGLGGVGGLVQPKPKKQNFIKRILESAKTGVASTRGSIATAGAGAMPGVGPQLPSSSVTLSGMPGPLSPSKAGRDAAREMGLGSGVDWVQVRRDVNRSNSLSRNERVERKERCQMLDYPALDPVDELYNCMDGDEGADGMPVVEPTNYQAINFSQVDKNSRFINNLPPSTTAIALATGYICRPYRSDVQRLRAIFSWVAETIAWEEDFEGEVDTRRVLQAKRGCAEEYAVLVLEMCAAVGLTCEVVRGYLKAPGEIPEANMVPRSNHWWNAVLVDNEWRMMDTCLASPSNPRRLQYSSSSATTADPWWFLTRPTELCWTHIPEHHSQQHICPPVAHEVLLNLPCACPPYFRNALHLTDYNTSLTRIEDLEMVHVKFNVPADVEVAAEVEVRAYSRDSDGDFFESGDVVKKRALAQAEWFGGVKRYTVKALLPGDEGTGTLKVYAGKRGLMHSIKDIPHPLAFALPIIHSGENPAYEFVTRHPTPHAQRHDIYIVQPQCQRLALNNTFVFAVRQHPSSLGAGPAAPSSTGGGASPIPFVRPGSAMSMVSSAQGSSSTASSSAAKKPAKLAIQTPGGKILRLMRKEERRGVSVAGRGTNSHSGGLGEDPSDGGMWETIIKCSERGVWRGLVLADRTARWCVFAEWVCQ